MSSIQVYSDDDVFTAAVDSTSLDSTVIAQLKKLEPVGSVAVLYSDSPLGKYVEETAFGELASFYRACLKSSQGWRLEVTSLPAAQSKAPYLKHFCPHYPNRLSSVLTIFKSFITSALGFRARSS